MNKKLIIKNQKNEVLQTCIFHEQELLDNFLELLATQHPWGKPSYNEKIFDKDGVKVIKTITHPAEYKVEIEDITSQIEQEKINTEAEAYLASTDWYVIREYDCRIRCPDEIRLKREAARASIVR